MVKYSDKRNLGYLDYQARVVFCVVLIENVGKRRYNIKNQNVQKWEPHWVKPGVA